MNRIEVKNIRTCYDYSEYYWLIDGKPITVYLDEWKQSSSNMLFNTGSLLGLLPAWGGKLEWQWENDFVWELIDSPEELNIPILVCEDDCDLSCIVIMVHVRRTEDSVFWDRIGILDHSGRSLEEEQQSGILLLDAYTDEDWALYGDNIATEKYGSWEYWNWVGENCYEEHIRRLRNYVKPYMQKDNHIEWLRETGWEFDREEYAAAVGKFRELKNSHQERDPKPHESR
ncbi:MAG: XRE family transcriptional regulator [Lachnospiraceae bacterium]|nr:XRE family transcriptional regulator [Lachnospiraceae bacterium]